jgi:protocatechuate 3,4-dioxygenase beta subunit
LAVANAASLRGLNRSVTEIAGEIQFGTIRALNCPWPNGGPNETQRDQTMFATFSAGRETATALAAAFITAMLFVSSATSLIA